MKGWKLSGFLDVTRDLGRGVRSRQEDSEPDPGAAPQTLLYQCFPLDLPLLPRPLLRFREIVEEVGRRRGGAKLSDHRDDLAAVESRVVDDVLHQRAERIGEGLALGVPIADLAEQVFISQARDKFPALILDLLPALA